MRKLRITIVQTLCVTLLISITLLLKDNVGQVNEVDILPFTRQHLDPSWIPNDFYLNQPAGYRWSFILLFGHLTTSVGFLATSIIGRLIGYTAVASGLVLLGRKIGLTLPSLLVAISLFIFVEQGYVAREWVIRGFESKVVAYSCLFWGIGALLSRRYALMAVMLGLAATFHVLVGGWGTVAVMGWLLLRRRQDFKDLSRLVTVLGLFLLSSAWAIWVILQHLLESTTSIGIAASYVYVYLRLPHHLNPLSWGGYEWVALLLTLVLFGASVAWLRKHQEAVDPAVKDARQALVEITLFTLVPFALGLALAPFDSQGKFLQYYPFRVGSLMLVLTTCLFLLCALQQGFGRWRKNIFTWLCILIIGVFGVIQATEFKENLVALQDFPGEEQNVNSEWKEMSTWIRKNTPKDALVISPPVDLSNFHWLTERATLAKYKQMPQTYAGIQMWYERMADLSGEATFWEGVVQRKASNSEIKSKLTAGYERLNTEQVKALLQKYDAAYFLTQSPQILNLPLAHSNSGYRLYSRREE
jgi:hypothetical protein